MRLATPFLLTGCGHICRYNCCSTCCLCHQLARPCALCSLAKSRRRRPARKKR